MNMSEILLNNKRLFVKCKFYKRNIKFDIFLN